MLLNTTSQQTLLSLIWYSSLVLAIFSLIILCVLIVRRAMFVRQHKRLLKRREELSKYFHVALRSPIEIGKSSLPKLSRSDVPIVTLIALDLLRTIKGQDALRIAKMVQVWNMLPDLERMVNEGRRGARIQALTLMSYLEDAKSLQLLVKHASASDPYVQLSALRGLAVRNASREAGDVIAALGASNQSNALMLADVLKMFGGSAISVLHELAAGDAATQIRIAAIIALGNIGSLDSVDLLCDLIKSPNAEIRAYCAEALGAIGDGRVGMALADALKDPDIQVRIQAAKALRSINAEGTFPHLIQSMDDDEWWVRFRAAETLSYSGDAGVAILKSVSALKNRSGVIAAQVLAEMSGR